VASVAAEEGCERAAAGDTAAGDTAAGSSRGTGSDVGSAEADRDVVEASGVSGVAGCGISAGGAAAVGVTGAILADTSDSTGAATPGPRGSGRDRLDATTSPSPAAPTSHGKPCRSRAAAGGRVHDCTAFSASSAAPASA
jgi:hypothetical protein